MGFSLARIALAFLLLSVADDDRPGDFKIIGPGGGGAMFHPQISPHDPNTVLVSCDMTGAYISHDGGKSWRMFNLRGVVEFFVFDPLDKKVMYAEANGLWRSQDGGGSWSLLYPRPSTVKGIKMSSDHSDENLEVEPNPLGAISAMAIDPANSKILYVTAGSRSQGTYGLFTSLDGGETWTKMDDLPRFAKKIYVGPMAAGGVKALLVAGSDFIEMRTSAGVRNIPIPNASHITDISAGFSRKGNPILYVVADESPFVSEDTGVNWRKVQLGKGETKTRAIATSLRNPETAYVSYRDLEEGGLKYMGVAKTTDSGHAWKPVWKEDSDMAGK